MNSRGEPVAGPTPPAKPARLAGIQALRGVASCSVVLYHSARHVDKAFGASWLNTVCRPGHSGVDLFFVISGFIILFVHRADIGRPDRLANYVSRRFSRVYPLYWFALALTLAMSALGRSAVVSTATVLRSATLMPSFREPILGIAWTLQFEVVFYAVFAGIIVRRGTGIALALIWLALVFANAFGAGMPFLPPQLTAAYGLEFFMGMAAAERVMAGFARPGMVAALGLALFAVAYVLESAGVLNGYGTGARIAYGASALLLVAGIARAEQLGILTFPAWLRNLGEASYSIYLFQFVFIGLVWQVWRVTGPASPLPCFLTLACVAIGGGVLAARFIETPLLRIVRGRVRHR